MYAARRVTILGATGSVGLSTAAVVEEAVARGEPLAVEAIAAGRDVEKLVALARRLKPRFVAIHDETQGAALKEALAGLDCVVGAGEAAVVEAAERDADWVMAAIVGAAGLAPTLAAAARGATVALANKESLVCAGDLLTRTALEAGAALIPVDSEHSAIFQVWEGPERVEKVTLTASGGPFRVVSRDAMAGVTPAQAVAHPTWPMGAKISVDCATMMNKGLELIEAMHLFSIEADRLDVLIHPQSIIHSLVHYVDGSVLAQLGAPDMRTPIAYALAWPDRMQVSTPRLDLAKLKTLSFDAPDEERFPNLRLAREAAKAGGGHTAILNAANEVAVAAFLRGEVGFLQMGEINARVMEATNGPALASIAKSPSSLDELRAIDQAARQFSGDVLAQMR
jgi:1-deoxy-D-xylulose-5-phosphate reductoisomerase